MAEQRIVAHQNPDAEDAQYLVHPVGQSPLELLPDTAWILIIDFLLTNYTRNNDNLIDYFENTLHDVRALSQASKTTHYRVKNTTGVIKDSDYETLYRMFLLMNQDLIKKNPDAFSQERILTKYADKILFTRKELFNLVLVEFLPKKKFLQNDKKKQYEALAIMNKKDRLAEMLDYESENSELKSSILCAAIKYWRFEIIDFLVNERGFDLEKMTREGNNPIFCAVWEFLHPENFLVVKGFTSFVKETEELRKMVRFLERRGANINGVDSNGWSALHIAVNIDYAKQKLLEKVVNMLIDEGIDVNAQDKMGATPLHYLHPRPWPHRNVQRDHRFTNLEKRMRIAEILLQRGADLYIKNKEGISPLDIALNEEYPPVPALFLKYDRLRRMTKILRDCGVDPSIMDNAGIDTLQENPSQCGGTVDSDFDVVLPPNKRNRSGGKFTQGIY